LTFFLFFSMELNGDLEEPDGLLALLGASVAFEALDGLDALLGAWVALDAPDGLLALLGD